MYARIALNSSSSRTIRSQQRRRQTSVPKSARNRRIHRDPQTRAGHAPPARDRRVQLTGFTATCPDCSDPPPATSDSPRCTRGSHSIHPRHEQSGHNNAAAKPASRNRPATAEYTATPKRRSGHAPPLRMRRCLFVGAGHARPASDQHVQLTGFTATCPDCSDPPPTTSDSPRCTRGSHSIHPRHELSGHNNAAAKPASRNRPSSAEYTATPKGGRGMPRPYECGGVSS